MKTIFRSVLTSDFTILPNSTLRDKRLSFKARGVLAWALSNRDDWEVTSQFLESQGKEGRLAIRSAMKELKELGYAKFERLTGENGKFNSCRWTFYDLPLDLVEELDSPEGRFTPDGFTPDGNRPYKEELSEKEPSKRKPKEDEEEQKHRKQHSNASCFHLQSRWNTLCATEGLPKVLGLSGKRMTCAAARMSEPYFVASFEEAMKKLSRSSFCKGSNERGWLADFDFLIRAGSIEKIMEGKYDDKKKKGAVDTSFAP